MRLEGLLFSLKINQISMISKGNMWSVEVLDLTAQGPYFALSLCSEVEGSEEDIDASVQSLRDHGFINYFGLQRFGSSPVASHEIGL